MARKRKYTDQEFINAVKTSLSVREALSKLHISTTGGSYKLFYKRCLDLNVDFSHFTGQGHLKNKRHNWTTKKSLDDILTTNSFYSNHALKARLISELCWEYKCNQCGIDSWQNKTITLHLDHINGINTDNTLKNLRLLCPNCHSQTSTYCVKNVKKFTLKEQYYCNLCNKKLLSKRKTGLCINCKYK